MPDRITSVIPRPTPVTVAGRVLPIWEARLCDLAELQSFSDARRPDPLGGLSEALETAGDDPRARDRVLLEAYDRAEAGAAGPGDDGDLTGTAEGVVAFLRVALGRSVPDVDAFVAEILSGEGPAITPDEFAAVKRAFYGSDPFRTIERLLGVPPAPPQGDPLTWGEAIDSLARSHGWTYATIYGLSLSEFSNARRHGKPRETGFRIPVGLFKEWQDRICLARYGVTSDEHFTAPRPVREPEPVWVHPEAVASSGGQCTPPSPDPAPQGSGPGS